MGREAYDWERDFMIGYGIPAAYLPEPKTAASPRGRCPLGERPPDIARPKLASPADPVLPVVTVTFRSGLHCDLWLR